MSFPGFGGSSSAAASTVAAGMGIGGGASTAGMSGQEAAMVKTIQAAMESCPVKSVMAGGMGFALGGAFGLFMSS
ncbi:hypothetical protein EMPG_15104, partial [Blastomyces silverae]